MRFIGSFTEARTSLTGDTLPAETRLKSACRNIFVLASMIESEAWKHHPIVETAQAPYDLTDEQLQGQLATLLAEPVEIHKA